MTMVAACRFSQGAAIIADSRVTWETPRGERIHSDHAQKILYLTGNLAIAFSGTVAAATKIIEELRSHIRRGSNAKNLISVPRKLTRVARFHYSSYLNSCGHDTCSVCFVLGCVGARGNAYLWTYKSPDFIQNPVHDWSVVGSGAFAGQYLAKNYSQIDAEEETLKAKTDAVMRGLEGELARHGVMSVGGLLQTILLTRRGICPLTYGFMDLKPESPARAKEITMSKGVWTQKDLTSQKQIRLVEPAVILSSSPQEIRFHDYSQSETDKTKRRWYLNHLITCLAKDKAIDKTTFKGVVSQIGSYMYPMTLPILASVELWGARGTYPLQFYQESAQGRSRIYEEEVHIEYPNEQVEHESMLKINVEEPGPVFIDCYIQDQLLGRKALFFGKPDGDSARDVNEMITRREVLVNKLVEAHRTCSDSALSNRSTFLDFFVICREAKLTSDVYEFSGEAKALYSTKYPVILGPCIATSFRFIKGRHCVRIDLVNAFTNESATIAAGSFEGSSECISVPVVGHVKTTIPKPGLYYFNLYVDDEFESSILLAAETDKPRFSYTLLDEHSRALKAGEPMILAKRSRQIGKRKPSNVRDESGNGKGWSLGYPT